MDTDSQEFQTQWMLDGNAVAGLLQEIFAAEMTVEPTRCAGCGREGQIGNLQVYLHGPGIVLRCPACQQIVMRIVQTPQRTYLDARGASYFSVPAVALSLSH